MSDDTLILRRIGAGPTYQNTAIWLPQMVAETLQNGQGVIEGKTFIGCTFTGPAVIAPLSGCDFDGCDMGQSAGDTRNLLLAPVSGGRVIGVLPFRDCVFTRCTFRAVGFTGGPEFLKAFEAGVATAAG